LAKVRENWLCQPNTPGRMEGWKDGKMDWYWGFMIMAIEVLKPK
jgi:hypothetical protein